MHVGDLTWFITIVVLVAVLLFDVLIIGRRPHEPSTRECVGAISVYVVGALVFAGFVWWRWGSRYAGEFTAGWLTEYSLSIDNLFVFIILMGKLKVPRHLQQYALLVGIIMALVLRGVFIAAGAAIIASFAWVFFIFGAFLVYVAFGLVRDYRRQDQPDEAPDNLFLRIIRKRLHFADDFHGTKLRVRIDGRAMMTPMFLVIVSLGSTDLLFALDSIPAIFGLTQQPYLVFAANVFALMGLRQLYFLIGGLLNRLVYLSIGLSVILAFIGVKLVLHALHHYDVIGFEVPLWVSLAIIVGTLAATAVASLLRSSHGRRRTAQ